MTTNAVILDAIRDCESGVYFSSSTSVGDIYVWQRVIPSASDMDFNLEYTSFFWAQEYLSNQGITSCQNCLVIIAHLVKKKKIIIQLLHGAWHQFSYYDF